MTSLNKPLQHSNSFIGKYLLYFVLVAVLFILFNFNEYIFYRPSGHHQWRQTDSGSIALNYYQFDNNLFTPELHQQFTKNGRTVGEFPIIYYTASKLYHLFGYKEYLFRLLSFFIFVFGGYALYRLCLDIFDAIGIALFSTVLYFSSPITNFYAISFIPDSSVLGLMIINLYYLHQFFKRNTRGYFWGFVISGIFISLIKPTFLILALAALCVGLIYFVRQDKASKKALWRKWRLDRIYYLALWPLMTISWVAYAGYYKRLHDNDYFLQGVVPIWLANEKQLKFIKDRMFSNWGWWPDILPEYYIYFFGIALISALFWKNRWLALWVLISTLGMIAFIILFGYQLAHHDYYIITIFPLIILTILGFIYQFWGKLQGGSKYVVYAVLLAASYYSIQHNTARQVERFEKFHWDDKYDALFDIEPQLDDIGITLDDFVYVCRDGSVQISLYLMNRKGWTNVRFDPEAVEEARAKKAKYLLVVNDLKKHREPIKEMNLSLLKKIDNIDIYKL